MKLFIAIIALTCLSYCDAIVCYNGVRTESTTNGKTIVNDTRKNENCTDGYSCARFDVDGSISGITYSVYIEAFCQPMTSCGALTCDNITQMLKESDTINSCQGGCCYTDGCNMEPVGSAGKLGGKTTTLALLAVLAAKAMY